MAVSSVVNPCIRCGLERVVAKTWTETIKSYMGESMVTHTLMVCPDPICQAKVETSLEANRVRLENIQTQKLESERLAKQKRLSSVRKRLAVLPQ